MQSESAPSTPASAGPAATDAPLSPELFKPLPARDPRFAFRAAVAAGALVLAVAGLAFYLYRTFFYADFSPAMTWRAPPTEERAGAAAGPMGTGVLSPTEATRPPTPLPGRGATAITPRSDEAPARADPPPASSPRTASAPATLPRSALRAPQVPLEDAAARAALRPSVTKPAAIASESCTEALVAMGLCTPAERPRIPARANTVAETAAPSQQDTATCREGVAALGLCTPLSSQRKE